jgi:hypothetical protein
MLAGSDELRTEDEKLPIPNMINGPDNTGGSVDSLRCPFEVCDVKMLSHLLPGFIQEDKGTEKIRHQFLKVPPGTALHLFAGPIGKCYLNVRPRQSAVTTEKSVPEPAKCLPEAKDPTQRKTSEQPPGPAIDQINDVIADFTERRPKIAHSNMELTFSAKFSQAKALVRISR